MLDKVLYLLFTLFIASFMFVLGGMLGIGITHTIWLTELKRPRRRRHVRKNSYVG